MEIKKQLTQHIRKYTELPEQDLHSVLAYFRPVSVARKVNLLEAGQTCRLHYFVGKGCLRMFFVDGKGNEQTSQFAIENWWLTDHVAFSGQLKSEFFIQSVERCELLAIDFHSQEQMLRSHLSMERYFRRIYEIVYGVTQRGAKFRTSFSGEELYLHFVNAFPDFVNRIPQYLLASYLGFTPEYLSEIRKSLRSRVLR